MKKIIHIILFLLLSFSYAQNGLKPINPYNDKANKLYSQLEIHYAESDFESYKITADSLVNYARQNNLTRFEAIGILNRGIYFSNMYEYEQALNSFHKALEVTHRLKGKEKVQTQTTIKVNLGNLYNTIGNYDKSIAVMQSVLALESEIKLPERIKIAVFTALSNSYDHLNDNEKALAYLMDAKKLAEQHQNQALLHSILNNIANMQLDLQNYNSAIVTCKEAFILDQSKSSVRSGWTYLYYGKALLYKQNTTIKGIHYIEKAKHIGDQKNIRELILESNLALSRAYNNIGKIEASAKAYENYIALVNQNWADKSKTYHLDQQKELDEKQQELLHIKQFDSIKNYIISIITIFLVLGLISLLFTYQNKKRIEKEFENTKHIFESMMYEHTALKFELEKILITNNPSSILFEDEEFITPEKYSNSSLTDKDRNQYAQHILDYMDRQKPFLNPELNQNMLADVLKMNNHHLSEVLSVCFEQNFYNFINLYRVNEVIRLMKSSEYKNHKLMAIAYEAGFNSKSTFNRIFKTVTGFTPSVYRKEQLYNKISA